MAENPGTFVYEKTLKPGYRMPLLSRLNLDNLLNRPLGGLVARAAFPTRITPNQLTYTSFFLTLAGAACFFLGASWRLLAAGALLQVVGQVFDYADGMLARARGQSSDFGAALDLMFDRIGDVLLYGSVLAAHYQQSHDLTFTVAGLAGLAVFNLQVALYYVVENYKKARQTGMAGEARGLISWLIVAATLARRLDLLIWMLIVVPVLNVLFRVVHFHWLGYRRGRTPAA